jgi:uncharacterized iron-regulated membrane protein
MFNKLELLTMKRFRKLIFWCHLVAGVIAGIIVLIMSLTGVLLMFERQITYWADTRNYQVTKPSNESTPLPVETLLANVGQTQPETVPALITMRADPSAPAAIGLNGGRTLFVNPYTGQALGEGSKSTHDFFRVVTDWHRWLGASGENRALARSITGACNLAFLFMVVSGFYLWWPRKWIWATLRNVLWFKRGLPGKARDFNWHNVIGLWSVVPLFIVVLSGVVISYTWAGNLVYRLVGETPPAPRTAPNQPTALQSSPPTNPEQKSLSQPTEGLNRGWERATQQVPDWQIISLRLPNSADAPLVFSIDQGDGGQPQKRTQLTFDKQTGDVTKIEPFSSNTPGRRLRSILRFAHTGEVAGIFGQTIAGLASLGGAFLVYTGLALSWRRLRAWVNKRSGKSLTERIVISKEENDSPIRGIRPQQADS